VTGVQTCALPIWIKLPNVRKALGQEEQQQPIMTQPVTQRPETTVEGDDTWKRRKPAFMPDYSKPFETEQPEKNYPERPAELGFIGRYTPERDKEKTPQFVEEALGALTIDTFTKKSADSSKKELEYYLKDMGFKIEESAGSSGYTGRYVDVISPRGEKYQLYLGNDIMRQETYGFAGLASEEDIEGLKNFVRVETFSDPGIAKKQYLYEKENKKFRTKEEIDSEISKLSENAELFKNESNALAASRATINELADKINSFPENLSHTDEFKNLVNDYNKRIELDKKAFAVLKEKEEDFISNENALKRAQGNYVKMREEQGNFAGAMWNKALGGAGKIASGLYDTVIDMYMGTGLTGVAGRAIMGNEEWEKQQKILKYGYGDGGFNPKEGLRGLFTSLFKDDSVTDEYIDKIQKDGSIIERGLLGLA
jgi:hypothetical protein